MQSGHELLIGTKFLVADTAKGGEWLGGIDGVPQVIGFGEIPLAVAAQLVTPDVIQSGVYELDVVAVDREPGDF